jgi:hypothetical protein
VVPELYQADGEVRQILGWSREDLAEGEGSLKGLSRYSCGLWKSNWIVIGWYDCELVFIGL